MRSIRLRCAKIGSKQKSAATVKNANLPTATKNWWHTNLIANSELKTVAHSTRPRSATTAAAACSDTSTATTTRSWDTTTLPSCTPRRAYSCTVRTVQNSSILTTLVFVNCLFLRASTPKVKKKMKNQPNLNAPYTRKRVPSLSSRWKKISLHSATLTLNHQPSLMNNQLWTQLSGLLKKAQNQAILRKNWMTKTWPIPRLALISQLKWTRLSKETMISHATPSKVSRSDFGRDDITHRNWFSAKV